MKVCIVEDCKNTFDHTTRGNRAFTCSPECHKIYQRGKTRELRRKLRASPEGQAKIRSWRGSKTKIREYNRLYYLKNRKKNRYPKTGLRGKMEQEENSNE